MCGVGPVEAVDAVGSHYATLQAPLDVRYDATGVENVGIAVVTAVFTAAVVAMGGGIVAMSGGIVAMGGGVVAMGNGVVGMVSTAVAMSKIIVAAAPLQQTFPLSPPPPSTADAGSHLAPE